MTELRFKRQYVMLIIIILMMVSIFTQITSASSFGNSISQLTDYEKSILFNESGIYNSPPMVPGEVRKQLAAWELPDWEKTDSKEKLDSRTYSDGTVDLVNGWNLISIPKKLDPRYDNIEFVLPEEVEVLYYYDADNQVWGGVYPGMELKPLVGYFIRSAGPSSLNTMYTEQTNPSVELYPGWNLIGFFDPMGNGNDDYLHAAMARDELVVLGENWYSAMGYDATTKQYEPSIIRGGSGIHSDFQLMYPEKGYWVYMYTDDTFAFSVTHTYTCSAEWVSDYPGDPGDSDLPDSDECAEGFYNTLNDNPPWDGAFIRGDNDTPMARAADWKDSSYPGGMDDNPSTGIDSTNFAYFSGHGWPAAGILFAYGYPDRNEQELWYNEAIWGDTNVDWIALDACSVLNESNNNYAVWQDSFKGLHSIVGWSTTGMCCEDTGLLFATNLLNGMNIWESWKDATDDVVHYPNLKVGILAVDIDGNTNTKECINDHIYGEGTWFSPPGYNVQFDEDFYDVNPN